LLWYAPSWLKSPVRDWQSQGDQYTNDNSDWQSTHPVLLLETLATCLHTYPRVNGTGCSASTSHTTWYQSQRSLTHGQDDRERCWYDKRLVSSLRSLESKENLGRTCLSSLNRRMRTRTSGGVGREVSNGRPYPIRQICNHSS
jgi:hypothetical protein